MSDTTPTTYPRPEDARVHEAMSVVFRIAECIIPTAAIRDLSLVNFIVARDTTVAQAMWAIHELTQMGGLRIVTRDEVSDLLLVNHKSPPAGVATASGALHLTSDKSSPWGSMLLSIDHKTLGEIRRRLNLEVTGGLLHVVERDKHKKTIRTMPDNPDVLDLCKKLSERKAGITQADVARTFTNEPKNKCPKAEALLRQARRFPHLWKADN